MARRIRKPQTYNSYNQQPGLTRSFSPDVWRNPGKQLEAESNFINFGYFAVGDETGRSTGNQTVTVCSGSFRLSHLLVCILIVLLFISHAVASRIVGNSLTWMLLAGSFLSLLLLVSFVSWQMLRRGLGKLFAVFFAFAIVPIAYLGANVYSVVYDSTIDAALVTRMPASPQFVFFTRNSGRNYTVALDESERFVSPQELWDSPLRPAIIYLEDERLLTRYTGPLDPEAIARAIKQNLMHFEIVEGGSGIEIQTGKLMTGFKTEGFLAKGTQALIAFRLDQRFSTPQEKLCLYANIVVLVGNKRGVGFAAAELFGVSDLRNLTPAQGALLAAMLKNPIIFDPRRNPQRALERRNIALQKMFEQKSLSKTEYEKAKAEEINILPRIKPRELFVLAAIEIHTLGKEKTTREEQTK